MRSHVSYLRYVLRHKWYVFLACRVLRVPLWRAVLHDWDKFLPGEWGPYVAAFYAPDGSSQYKPTPTFHQAWNAHQKRNRHHWQYWLLTWDHGGTEVLEMAETDVREMVADWMGAGRALGKPDTRAWYEANKDKMQLHPATRQLVERLLEAAG